MLKINSKNEKLNRRMVKKELSQLLYHLNLCFRGRTFLQRYFLNNQLKKLTFSPFTKIRTICFLTGRSRSIYRSFRLSRLKIREYAGFGYFPGLSKAS